jgi:hypothetical protein
MRLVVVGIALWLGGCSSDPAPGDGPLDAAVDGSTGDSPATDAPASGVTPYDCPKGAPEAVFVTEVAPPSTMAPWTSASTSVTYANCGATTWSATASPPTGIKLGPAAPHDLGTWTPGRILLPLDVPPAHQVVIPITVHAPPLTGPHAYAFELVRDGAAWLGQPSPTHTIDVEPAASAPIALCGTTTADPTGKADAHAALQACIDATPDGGTLALPAGIFRLSGVVSITHAMTLTTAGASSAPNCLDYAAPPCAVLRADDVVSPSGASTRGFFRLGTLATQVSQVTLDHVVVDGNRAQRLSSGSAAKCAAGTNGDGINVGANCLSCTLGHMVSARALCGSGMEWDGDGITVTDSVFIGNGDHATNNMWSDGLTIHKSDNGTVAGCAFIDNSDVGLISGGGTNAKYTSNVASQLSQSAFAAIMLDNFNSGALGDHTGAVMSGNSVACPATCHFGIELGPHPWYASPNIKGGTVTGNTVVGANIEINAQGAGTSAAPIVISSNTLGPVPSSAKFLCGTVSGLSPLNVSSESVVDLKGGSATGTISVPCP